MICAVTGHRPDKLYGYNMSHPRYTMLRNAFKKLLIKWDCSVGITGRL